ncbi:hypothetical protein C8Q75DRAFT_592465 [Abortiporus biennis]|nr:hypothetical protein C8Q75DRAFT_592465 [Abortiporus biennis]
MSSKHESRYPESPSSSYERQHVSERRSSPGSSRQYPYDRYMAEAYSGTSYRGDYPSNYRTQTWRPDAPSYSPSSQLERFSQSRGMHNDSWTRTSSSWSGPSETQWTDSPQGSQYRSPYDTWPQSRRDTLAERMFEPSDSWKQYHETPDYPPTERSGGRVSEANTCDTRERGHSPDKSLQQDAYSPADYRDSRYPYSPPPSFRERSTRSDSYRTYGWDDRYPQGTYQENYETRPQRAVSFAPRPYNDDYSSHSRVSHDRSNSPESSGRKNIVSPGRSHTSYSDRRPGDEFRRRESQSSYAAYDKYTSRSEYRSRSSSRSSAHHLPKLEVSVPRRESPTSNADRESLASTPQEGNNPYLPEESEKLASQNVPIVRPSDIPSKAPPDTPGSSDESPPPGLDIQPPHSASYQPATASMTEVNFAAENLGVLEDRRPTSATTTSVPVLPAPQDISPSEEEILAVVPDRSTPPHGEVASILSEKPTQVEPAAPVARHHPTHKPVLLHAPARTTATPDEDIVLFDSRSGSRAQSISRAQTTTPSFPPTPLDRGISREHSVSRPSIITLPQKTSSQTPAKSEPPPDISFGLHITVTTRLRADRQTREDLVEPILRCNKLVAGSSKLYEATDLPVKEVYEGARLSEREKIFETAKPSLELIFARSQYNLTAKVKQVREEYSTLHEKWLKHCAKLDEVAKATALEEAAATAGRTTRRTANLGDAVRSDLEMEQIIASLGNEELTDATLLSAKNAATIPDMISVTKGPVEYYYDDTNNIVDNPGEFYAPHTGFDDWTDEEVEIFLQKFAEYPKQFAIISDFLPHKTTAQCVTYYYLHKHKHIDFRKVVSRFTYGRRRRGKGGAKKKGNALLADILKRDAEVSRGHTPGGSSSGRKSKSATVTTADSKKPPPLRRTNSVLEHTPATTPTPDEDEQPKKKKRRVNSNRATATLEQEVEDNVRPPKHHNIYTPLGLLTVR